MIKEFLQQKEIFWVFNPPTASHMGGVWERMIRSVCKILNAVLKEQNLTEESLVTLMCEVEAILNSRPLTKISDDPSDLQALTPNHLLLLRAGPSFPPGMFLREDQYTNKRWKQVQYLSDVFLEKVDQRISAYVARTNEVAELSSQSQCLRHCFGCR